MSWGTVKTVAARWATDCPQCGRHADVGDTIGQPQVRNRAGGRKYVACWYCVPCATDLQELEGPVAGGLYLTAEDREADEARRRPIIERLRRRADGGSPQPSRKG